MIVAIKLPASHQVFCDDADCDNHAVFALQVIKPSGYRCAPLVELCIPCLTKLSRTIHGAVE